MDGVAAGVPDYAPAPAYYGGYAPAYYGGYAPPYVNGGYGYPPTDDYPYGPRW